MTTPTEPEMFFAHGSSPEPSRRRTLLPVLASLLALAVLVGGGWLVFTTLLRPAVSPDEVCTLTAESATVKLTHEQVRNAAIIVGVAMADENLGERAAHIAIATAYQESGLRNLNYGDRDSLGLFQQRPSQGWGTAEQVRDPWYASKKFYSVLVKQKNWRTGDVNDIAQKVQRSGVPDGYRKHVDKAQAVAAVLSGRVPGAITCVDRQNAVGAPSLLASDLQKTYGVKPVVKGKTLTVTAKTPALAWALAHQSVADTRSAGVVSVQVANQVWTVDGSKPRPWSVTTAAPAQARTVVVTFR